MERAKAAGKTAEEIEAAMAEWARKRKNKIKIIKNVATFYLSTCMQSKMSIK